MTDHLEDAVLDSWVRRTYTVSIPERGTWEFSLQTNPAGDIRNIEAPDEAPADLYFLIERFAVRGMFKALETED